MLQKLQSKPVLLFFTEIVIANRLEIWKLLQSIFNKKQVFAFRISSVNSLPVLTPYDETFNKIFIPITLILLLILALVIAACEISRYICLGLLGHCNLFASYMFYCKSVIKNINFYRTIKTFLGQEKRKLNWKNLKRKVKLQKKLCQIKVTILDCFKFVVTVKQAKVEKLSVWHLKLLPLFISGLFLLAIAWENIISLLYGTVFLLVTRICAMRLNISLV